MKIKNMPVTGLATAAALGAMAPVASADSGAPVGDENIGAATATAGAFGAAHDNLDFNHIADRWNIEVLNNSPVANDLTQGAGGGETVWGTAESQESVPDLANVTDSVNETGRKVLAS
ncbi:hypothetical protein OG625_27625 [Streptomyces sp. NBC_01351]|uniref:hypothetical protein n=1 Tax=Streptomyces sp. NBC_01351 TaxID=2903833 RepID=UPI002E2F0479|nr:hypothetical protein [Streptomyces sp. NBC_01351]